MNYYSGVPDSELKDDIIDIIATDEGEAVGIAVGKYLATGEKQWVYTQPNGFANALEALTSLVMPYGMDIDIKVSACNFLPQHIIMAKLTPVLMSILKLFLYDKRTNN
jgi:phosphonopyruvate decarboxylase